LSEPLRFEWDETKAETNIHRHGVSFAEAATVFADPEFITFLDEEHSAQEERHITLGLSKSRGLLMVAHTERGGRIRIISARKATKKEGQFYAEAE
jgi:uncharacterized DUF497 family protein